MSFFRVLLALLISGGIAYGLYNAVDGKGVESVVEAVRTEIDAPDDEAADGAADDTAAETASGADDTTTETAALSASDDTDGEAEAETEAEAAGDNPNTAAGDGDTSETAQANGNAEADATTGDDDESVATLSEDTGGDNNLEGDAEEDVAAESEAANSSGGNAENNVPRIAALPSPPEAVLPDDAQAPAALEEPAALEDQSALPAARIAGSTSDSVDALQVVNGGMSYGEARETLIGAGWTPRVPEWRTDPVDGAETALIEAGYAELESCNADERPLCRFEFVDGEKRIAAVVTRGTGTDPSVIDAFLMNIKAE